MRTRTRTSVCVRVHIHTHLGCSIRTGETSELGEGRGLDGALFGSLDFIDRLRAVGVCDEGGVGRVKHQNLAVGSAEVDKLRELRLGRARASRIVGVAEHQDVAVFGHGDVRVEAVVRGAGHVCDAVVLLGVRVAHPGAAGDDGGVNIHGVGRVLRGHLGLGPKQKLQAPQIALRAV